MPTFGLGGYNSLYLANNIFYNFTSQTSGSGFSLYRTNILLNSKSSQGNNNFSSMYGRFSYFDIRNTFAFYTPGYGLKNNHYLYQDIFVWVDIANNYYGEPSTNPNSVPGARTLGGFGNPFYTTSSLSLNGPWSAWGWGSWASGYRFVSSGNTSAASTGGPSTGLFGWTFECWIRPIYNSAGTIDPAVGTQYGGLVYPAPLVINPIAYDATWNSGCPSGSYAGIGLWVDQYKICVLERGSDYCTVLFKYAYNFNTSKFYQIVLSNDGVYGSNYRLYINGVRVAYVTLTCRYGRFPVLDLSELFAANPYNWGGSNPFFVGWASKFTSWNRWLQDKEVADSFNYSAHRYGLTGSSGNPSTVCAWSPTYNMYTNHLMYDDGSVVDTGTLCAQLP
jgi:hypothetical protein